MIPPIPPIPNQFSGPQAQRAQSPLSRNFTPPVPQNANAIQRDLTGGGAAGGPWAVTPADKQRFDAVFLTVDKAGRGFITGDEAVPFFSNSKLPEDVLAQIWDLADIHKAGQLNRDEFAIAMYLIVQQRSNPGMLPETLPLSLIPPSVRQQRQLTGPGNVPVHRYFALLTCISQLVLRCNHQARSTRHSNPLHRSRRQKIFSDWTISLREEHSRKPVLDPRPLSVHSTTMPGDHPRARMCRHRCPVLIRRFPTSLPASLADRRPLRSCRSRASGSPSYRPTLVVPTTLLRAAHPPSSRRVRIWMTCWVMPIRK